MTDTASRPTRNLAATHGITGAALAAKQFAPARFLVPGYLPDGTTLLAGAPKIGKSWMALNIAEAIAAGMPVFGIFQCRAGDVLYLALEDNERRLKGRREKMGAPPSERITFMTHWPILDEGGLEEMEAWIRSVPDPVLIVVDVLTKVRPRTSENAQVYEGDYRALTGMHRIASDHGISILVVTHTRKAQADDPFDAVSGTRGLTGAADTVLVLKRDMAAGRVVLYGRGRDIAEVETVVEFAPERGSWRIVGPAAELGRSDERQAILDILAEAGRPLSAREVADMAKQSYDNVRCTLARMALADEIGKQGRGLYCCLSCPEVPSGDVIDMLDL